MTLPNLCPFAKFRPLSDTQSEPRIVPRLLIFHTMVGFLKSSENYFKRNNGVGYSGTESTYGVGGPWDGADLDGALWQWQGNLFQADAQYAGNLTANSVETSDGGLTRTPAWSPKQVDTLVRLSTWWFKMTGYDPVLTKSYDGRGFGYHNQFGQWTNFQARACPSKVRTEQLIEVIIPRTQKALSSAPVPVPLPPSPTPSWFPPFPLSTGKWFGAGGVMSGHGLGTWQKQMRNRGWFIVADGVYGPQTRSVALDFQAEKGLIRDGLVGKKTWDAAWRTRITAG